MKLAWTEELGFNKQPNRWIAQFYEFYIVIDEISYTYKQVTTIAGDNEIAFYQAKIYLNDKFGIILGYSDRKLTLECAKEATIKKLEIIVEEHMRKLLNEIRN